MTGWDTRAASGLKAPRAISTNINPTHGVAMHYGGSGPFRRNSHADCRAIWRAWQNFHMSPSNANNYNDIAYNLGVCHHDIVLEGRSTATRPKIRGGANGNATVNGNRYSVVAIWGANDGAWPDGLKRAWRHARNWLRSKDSRTSTGLTPHSAMASTSCPGNAGRAWLAAGIPAPGGTTPPPPPPPPGGSWMSDLNEPIPYYFDGRNKDGSWPTEPLRTSLGRTRSRAQTAHENARLAANRTATLVAGQAALKSAISDLAKAVASNEGFDPDEFARLVQEHADAGAESALRRMISDARVELTVDDDEPDAGDS